MNDETSLAVYVASAGSKHIDWVLKKEMGDSEQDRISLRTIKVYCRFEAEGHEITLPKVNHATTHRFGQIISGWLGDKFDAFKLITIGLVLSAAMNVLLPLFPEPYIMVVFW